MIIVENGIIKTKICFNDYFLNLNLLLSTRALNKFFGFLIHIKLFSYFFITECNMDDTFNKCNFNDFMFVGK